MATSRCVLLAPFGFASEARPAKGHENRGARAGGVEEGWREIGEMRINVQDGIRAHQETGRMSMRVLAMEGGVCEAGR
ncbi:hypothetical protein VSDG_01999 [Cytospora chrysosperma]|uniref:Uncharacterized protein n=1 Tax=Cytospora chrysosperma TaxID=252740 RepID=A0A423WDN0_CYTCH|nr:hypothetical protein VSDG_01999 [Valsa sordida]